MAANTPSGRNMPESEEDFMTMQQEAIRRVREMQQRARRTLESAGLHIDEEDSMQPAATPEPEQHQTQRSQPRPHPPAPPPPRKEPPPQTTVRLNPPIEQHKKLKNNSPLPGLNISLDTDQIMIAILLYVLYTDGADQWLMLALVYVMFT